MDTSVLVIVSVIGGGLLLAGLFRPFLELLLLMTLHFAQPAEMIPALAPLRIEFVYGLVVFRRLG